MGPGHASTSSVSSTVGGSGVSDLEPAPDSDSTSVRYLALDTNVLLNHFALVKSLHGRLLCGDSWLLVPATVISELDGLKASNKPTQPGSRLSIGDVARSATAWMLDLVRSEKRGAPVRLRVESWSDAAKTQPGARSADATILACCIHYRASGPVTLWTNDRNLALLAETNGIPSVDGRVGLARLCAALGIEDNGELEAMDVDGSGVETDDSDLPLFSRRPAYVMPYKNTHRASSVPDLRHPPFPPPGSLAAAAAEAGILAPSPKQKRKRSFATGQWPTVEPPEGGPRKRSKDNETTRSLSSVKQPSSSVPSSPKRHSSDLASTSLLAAAMAEHQAKIGITTRSCSSMPSTPNRPSTLTRHVSIPAKATTTTPTPNRPRPLPPPLMTSLTSILSQTYAYVDPTAQPPTDPTPATLAAKIAARLTDLVLDSNNQSQARPLARCADAARTIASWLVIPRPGARTVRNGQAADALMVLCAELASLSVALKKEEWERVAEAVRSC